MSSTAMKNNIYISMSRKGLMKDKEIEKDEIKQVDNVRDQGQNQKGVSSQMQRKARRHKFELSQCKMKISELEKKLKLQIQPQRQSIIKQLLSRHEQIVILTKSITTNNQELFKQKQNTNRQSKEKLFEQKLLLQAIEHKQQLKQSIDKVQKQIQKLELRKTQLQIYGKAKIQQINQKKDTYQQIKTNFYNTDSIEFNTDSIDYKQHSLESKIQNAIKFNLQLKDCLTSRQNVHIQLRQAIDNKQKQLQKLTKQTNQLQSHIQLTRKKLQEKRQLTLNSLNEQSRQQEILNHITMQNTQLKARLQILKHTLSQQINKSNSLHDQIYRNHQLYQQSQQAQHQTNSILQQLIKIKLQTQYLQSKTIYQSQQ